MDELIQVWSRPDSINSGIFEITDRAFIRGFRRPAENQHVYLVKPLNLKCPLNRNQE